MEINWLALLYDQQFNKALNRKAAKTFAGDTTAQEEAVSYALERLSQDDWAMCKQHSGLVSPSAYLMTLCSRLFIEYARKQDGRPRPPEWLKREGPFWETLWRELCMQRDSVELVTQRHLASGQRDLNSIRLIIRTIKAKLPWCGVANRPESRDDEHFNEQDELAHSTSMGIDQDYQRQHFEQFLSIAHLILGGELDQVPLSGAQAETITQVVKGLQLSSQERLMLRMHYVDGLSHSAVARKLNVAKHIPVRQNKKILQRLINELQRCGIEMQAYDSMEMA